jgi:hypothetical protein
VVPKDIAGSRTFGDTSPRDRGFAWPSEAKRAVMQQTVPGMLQTGLPTDAQGFAPAVQRSASWTQLPVIAGALQGEVVINFPDDE